MNALIIEDTKNWGKRLQRTLHRMGYEYVEYVINPEDATLLLNQDSWDLIVSVLKFHKKFQFVNPSSNESHSDWLRQLRQLYRPHGCPIILIKETNDPKPYTDMLAKLPSQILVRIDYTEEYLRQAIQIAENRCNKIDWLHPPFKNFYQDSILQKYIFIAVGNKLLKYNPDDIFYLHAKEGYIYIYMEDKKPVQIIKQTMSKIIDDLPKDQFFMPHRGFYVNVKKIASIDPRSRLIVLESGLEIPINKETRDSMKENLKIW